MKILQVLDHSLPTSDQCATRSTAGAAEAVRARHALCDAHARGFIGCIFAWEYLPLLLAALPRVISRRPDTRVLLVGGGAEDGWFHRLTVQLGLTKHVVLTGQVPHRDSALQAPLRENCPKCIARERTWGRVLPRYLEVYARVLGHSPQPVVGQSRQGAGAS